MKRLLGLLVATSFIGCQHPPSTAPTSEHAQQHKSRSELMEPQEIQIGERTYTTGCVEFDLDLDGVDEILVSYPWTYGTSGLTTCRAYTKDGHTYRSLGTINYASAFRALPPTKEYSILVRYYARGGGGEGTIDGVIITEGYRDGAFAVVSTEEISFEGDPEEAQQWFNEVFWQ